MDTTVKYLNYEWTNEKILSISAAIDTALNGRSLDVDTIKITISTANRNEAFATNEEYLFATNEEYLFVASDQSDFFSDSFVENAPVRIFRGGSQVSIWYLSKIERDAPNVYTLSAVSQLGMIAKMPHKGGVYAGQTALSVIDDICQNIPHTVDAAFQNVKLYGWLPYVSPSGENGAQTGSAKDNLLQVLFALNANLRDNSEGVIVIGNLPTATSSIIPKGKIYSGQAKIIKEPPVTSVTVLEHQYIAGGEEKLLFDGSAFAGQVIVFDNPMSNLVATGMTIGESNANYAVISNGGSGTLTGQQYTHITREITKPVSNYGIENAVRIEKATLVGLTNSDDVANKMADYYAHRRWIEATAVVESEDAGDVIEIYNNYDKVSEKSCIEKISPLVYSSIAKGKITSLADYSPWQVVPFEDVRVVVTSNQSVTIPSNASGITVVLIGGGNGGYSGGNGYPGDDSQSPEFTVYILGDGGEGGIAGDGGLGGKILRSELSPGTYTVTVGTGGAGGNPSGYSNNAGESGSATTISGNGVSLSSASGESLPNGYTDPITGDTYAQTGTSGVAGVGGGKRSSLNGYASNGESLTVSGTTWRGGYGGGVQELYNDYQQVWWIDYHGGGGGAAYGSVGGNAPTSVQNNDGGSGANAVAPSASTGIGTGGNGGNGGGGGGGAGVAWWEIRPRYISASGGAGGSGSQGGTGSSGGAIFYYRVPVTN